MKPTEHLRRASELALRGSNTKANVHINRAIQLKFNSFGAPFQLDYKKQKPGDVVVWANFQANSEYKKPNPLVVHQVEPVTTGEKIIFQVWVEVLTKCKNAHLKNFKAPPNTSARNSQKYMDEEAGRIVKNKVLEAMETPRLFEGLIHDDLLADLKEYERFIPRPGRNGPNTQIAYAPAPVVNHGKVVADAQPDRYRGDMTDSKRETQASKGYRDLEESVLAKISEAIYNKIEDELQDFFGDDTTCTLGLQWHEGGFMLVKVDKEAQQWPHHDTADVKGEHGYEVDFKDYEAYVQKMIREKKLLKNEHHRTFHRDLTVIVHLKSPSGGGEVLFPNHSPKEGEDVSMENEHVFHTSKASPSKKPKHTLHPQDAAHVQLNLNVMGEYTGFDSEDGKWNASITEREVTNKPLQITVKRELRPLAYTFYLRKGKPHNEGISFRMLLSGGERTDDLPDELIVKDPQSDPHFSIQINGNKIGFWKNTSSQQTLQPQQAAQAAQAQSTAAPSSSTSTSRTSFTNQKVLKGFEIDGQIDVTHSVRQWNEAGLNIKRSGNIYVPILRWLKGHKKGDENYDFFQSFRKVDVPRDGNCGAYCLATLHYAMSNSSDRAIQPEQVREAIGEIVKGNYYNPHSNQGDPMYMNETQYVHYLETLKNNERYLEFQEIAVFCLKYKINCAFIRPSPSKDGEPQLYYFDQGHHQWAFFINTISGKTKYNHWELIGEMIPGEVEGEKSCKLLLSREKAAEFINRVPAECRTMVFDPELNDDSGLRTWFAFIDAMEFETA